MVGEEAPNWCSTSLDYATDYIDNCMKVSREDIRKFIGKYIAGKPYVAGMIISPELNKTANTSSFFKPAL